jgi:hypothetical protein
LNCPKMRKSLSCNEKSMRIRLRALKLPAPSTARRSGHVCPDEVNLPRQGRGCAVHDTAQSGQVFRQRDRIADKRTAAENGASSVPSRNPSRRLQCPCIRF